MATNGNLNFTNVNKVTFEGVGAAPNAVIDTTTGKIGVGVDSPDANLHVVGNCHVSTNMSVGGVLNMGVVNVAARHTLEAITSLGASTPSTLTLTNTGTSLVASGDVTVDTNTFHVDTANSRVGIGTNAPDVKLHVGGGNIRVDGTGERIIENRNDSSDYGTLTLTSGYSGGSQRPKIQIHGYKGQGTVNGDNILTFHTNGSERMKINQSGYVGIGTTSPGSLLSVQSTSGNQIRLNYNDSYYNIIERDSSGNLNFGERPGSGAVNTYITMKSGGNVGIGTTTPHAKLQVNGQEGSVSSDSLTYINTWSANPSGSGNFALSGVSIHASHDIVSGSYIASHRSNITASDERIKKDIIDAEDGPALETLRLLKPKRYKYKDVVRGGTDPVWGFIAQEVRETLSYATQLRQDSIPNIYEMVNISTDSSVITFTNFDTSTLESGTKVLKVFDESDAEHFITFTEVIDDKSLRIEEDLSKWTQLFVYGQRVDDFVFLKKDAIWTVATAALQEVDRQLQAEKEKVRMLEDHLTRFTVQVTARLAALESKK